MIDPATLELIIKPLVDRIHALEIQDPNAGLPAWTDFTPTVIQGAVTFGIVTREARWRRAAKTVDMKVNIEVSTGLGSGSTIFVRLPAGVPTVRNTTLHSIVGNGITYNPNTGLFTGLLVHPRAPGDFYFFRTEIQPSNLIGLDPPIAFSVGFQLSFSARYETT